MTLLSVWEADQNIFLVNQEGIFFIYKLHFWGTNKLRGLRRFLGGVDSMAHGWYRSKSCVSRVGRVDLSKFGVGWRECNI